MDLGGVSLRSLLEFYCQLRPENTGQFPSFQGQRQAVLPVEDVCDCGWSVAKDPGLNVHGLGVRIRYGEVHHPLQPSRLVHCTKQQ